MRKTIHNCLLFLLLFSYSFLNAKQVSESQAEQIAKDIFKYYATSSKLNIGKEALVASRFAKQDGGSVNFYIFNFQPRGFVIVAGDDAYRPILAYSDESTINFQDDEKNIGLWGTLSVHEQRIQYLRENKIEASESLNQEWQILRGGNLALEKNEMAGVIVAPMTTTKWNQGEFYNAFCPSNSSTVNGPAGRTYCGCLPVAMAQLIKFHNYPAKGNGSNTYTDPAFGVQTADFCNTQYNWASMPNELTGPNADVSRLIYHMGVSTNTSYSTSYTSTFVSYVRDAYVNFFNFDESATWFKDANLNQFNPVAKSELDKGRPLLLTGTSLQGGAHAWVADGYGTFSAPNSSSEVDYFHFNWGWGGFNNGWFLDAGNQWTNRPDQPNTQLITYYWERYVVYKLFPSAVACQTPKTQNLSASPASETSAYLYISNGGNLEHTFQYRERGQSAWISGGSTLTHFKYVDQLKPGTTYEYQARRKCCSGDFSDYTTTLTFTTNGTAPPPTGGGCGPITASQLTTSSIGDKNAYVYTPQPFGMVMNQFRYKPESASTWNESDMTTSYYRYLSNLASGTRYEFQVRHNCSGTWGNYSSSQFFTTTGNPSPPPPPSGSCAAEDGNRLSTSSIGPRNAYIYTTRPYGEVLNQFRYRPEGSGSWTESDMSTIYYRYLSNLTPNTRYEFQVRHQCSGGTWSEYSTSLMFMTTAGQ